jgi:hypothetical protein
MTIAFESIMTDPRCLRLCRRRERKIPEQSSGIFRDCETT